MTADPKDASAKQPPPTASPACRSGIGRSKSELRALMRQQLKQITVAERVQASAEICRRLAELEIWRNATSILGYAPRGDELDIAPLLDSALNSGRLVALPQFDSQTGSYHACAISRPLSAVAMGSFGIREPDPGVPPITLNQLDLILVPGLAFDLVGHRLGRGRGYYDALLTGVVPTKCGLSFDEQVRTEIPVESHDVILDCILTPTRWLDLRPRRNGDDLVG